jgi:ATP-dependent Clp protease protease subunit
MARIPKDWVDAYFDHGIDISNRRIFLFDDVEEVSIGTVIKGLYQLEATNKSDPIELFVGSFGGSEYEMLALYDVLQNGLRCPIHTIAIGKCMSAAPLLVAAGEVGERWATPNAQFMVHMGSAGVTDGRVEVSKAEVVHAEILGKIWYELMARHTQRPASHWRRLCKKVEDSYFDSETAIEWGIIDQIWSEKS